MNQNGRLKIFISYSHDDEKEREDFIKHIAPLKNNGIIEDWYDRKIIPGHSLQDDIFDNLESADIICLLISANFLSSEACMEEKRKALEFKEKKGIAVVAVILSPCGWRDDKELFSLLALPTDGKPISKFTDSNNAWNNVYKGLKVVIENEIKIKQLKITEQFSSFLQNTDMLTKAHSQKERVLLDDIFVYPELQKYDDLQVRPKRGSSETLIKDFCDYSKVLIAGENQSGKTTLCKKIWMELQKKKFVPVYTSEKTNPSQGKIENRISRAYKKQYEIIPIEEIDKQRIVPIIDDFHFAKNKEKYVHDLSSYRHQVIVVDDIFSLNFKDENLSKSYIHFKINEFIPSLRNQLIEKWTHLTDKKNNFSHNKNKIYEGIDKTTELVNTALGKVIGSGIMPAYPFFILSVISTHETFIQPLDQEITSQGYCYQALIYLYLRKQGVKNDEIDTYMNFLTEFAIFFYTAKKNELSKDEFNSFMESYLDKYNFPIEQETLLSKLRQTQIISLDNLNNYSFCYSYIYYFFVAKYLAEHIEDNEKIIDLLISNLHKDENAYIAIFISHHAKSDYVLEEILLNSSCLFEKYAPTTLSKDELSFFDKQLDIIVKAVLPSPNVTPEKERAARLETQDVAEKTNADKKNDTVREEENADELALEFRRSIKTVEVMGRIIKNRAGSLEKSSLEIIFEEAMKVHLRILTAFFELIKNEDQQREVVDFISDRLNEIIEHEAEERKKEGRKERKPSKEELEKISKTLFWNLSFFGVYGLINKIVHSVGSSKLITITNKVCDNENTPASFLVKHGIFMWYNKNVQIDNIAKRIDEGDFSETAKRVMRFMVADHCSMHSIDFKEKQKIESKLEISSEKLLLQQAKNK